MPRGGPAGRPCETARGAGGGRLGAFGPVRGLRAAGGLQGRGTVLAVRQGVTSSGRARVSLTADGGAHASLRLVTDARRWSMDDGVRAVHGNVQLFGVWSPRAASYLYLNRRLK